MMLFDAHADILIDIYESLKKGIKDPFTKRHLKAYQQSGISHSIFVNWTDPDHKTSKDFDDCFDVAINYIKAKEDIFKICYQYDDILNAYHSKKFGVILGVEGLKYLKDETDLKRLYEMGIRHASLTWNEVNDYATGLSSKQGGLTNKGRTVIQMMEELGMVIDLSHANEQTFKDVYEMVKGPIVVTHGNAKALCDHQRNYSDEQLEMIKAKNGVIGVCAVASFISDDPSKQTVQYLAQHIDYIVKTIGIDYVGIGLDVCYYLYKEGRQTNVEGLQTIKDTPNLLKELQKMGYSNDAIEKIAYKNFNRVLKQVLK